MVSEIGAKGIQWPRLGLHYTDGAKSWTDIFDDGLMSSGNGLDWTGLGHPYPAPSTALKHVKYPKKIFFFFFRYFGAQKTPSET